MKDEVHSFLTKHKRTKARIVCIDELIADLRLMMQPSGIRYDQDRVQSTPKDPMPEYAGRLNELELKKAALQRKYLEERDEVEAAVRTLEDVYVQQVMTMRYLNGRAWDDIIEQMPFVDRTVFRFHKTGIQGISKYLDEHKLSVNVSKKSDNV